MRPPKKKSGLRRENLIINSKLKKNPKKSPPRRIKNDIIKSAHINADIITGWTVAGFAEIFFFWNPTEDRRE